MAKINKDYGHGALSDESSGGKNYPSLGQTLRDVSDDLEGIDGGAPAWSAAIALTTNQAVLTQAGLVVSVYASAGGTPGPKALIPTGTPGAGQARVTYAANGIPTILLASGDSHTAIQVQQIKRTTGFVRKTVKG